jgi:hypothetical protein
MPDSSKTIIEPIPDFMRRDADVYPLDECYQRQKRSLPLIEMIAGTKMPEPYHTLLVHNSDMTSTLENFHRARIHLTLLRSWRKDESYFREVVLTLDGSDKRVEFGAIKISLGLFEDEPRRLILKEHLPLGRILNDFGVVYHSNPRSFFKIHADDFIGENLQLTGRQALYARRNVLSNPKGEALAEIVEILPP